MPTLTQGNVFDAAQRTPLAVVFGHTGFNLMSMHWSDFAKRIPKLSDLANPFRDRPRQPIEWAEGRWLWMVACTAAEGFTEDEHKKALGEAVAWALQMGIGSIVTNGAANRSSAMCSTNARPEWLITYASNLERSHGIAVELISLSDIYVAMEHRSSGT
jgi:hypothetical protein